MHVNHRRSGTERSRCKGNRTRMMVTVLLHVVARPASRLLAASTVVKVRSHPDLSSTHKRKQTHTHTAAVTRDRIRARTHTHSERISRSRIPSRSLIRFSRSTTRNFLTIRLKEVASALCRFWGHNGHACALA